MDGFLAAGCAARVAGAVPGARLALLTDCGHFAYRERPDETRRVIGDFLRDFPGDRADPPAPGPAAG